MEKTYHVIIAEERRTDARKDRTVKHEGQIHDMGRSLDNPADPNIAYAASWDGVAPYIELHKGTVADLKMAFMGWPMITKAEWEAQQ